MNRFLTAMMGIALCLFVTSCEPKTELSVNQSSLTFDNKGGSQTLTVTANKGWSVSCDQSSWCKVSPSTGDGKTNNNVSVTVTCDPNATYDSRSCTLTIVCEELTSTVKVTQAEGIGLILSQTDFNLNNEAQDVSIEVKSNVDYLVSVEGDATSWIKVKSTKGLNSSTIVLAVSENKDYDDRTGKVTVRDVSGELSQTITIKQGEAYGLFITKPEYNLSNEAHTLTVEVKANVSFDVVSEVDWIGYVETKGLKTSQIVLEVAANDTYDTREGKVTVRQTGGALSETITIRQDEALGLIISKTGYGLSCEEQTIDVEVKYNIDLEVVIPDDCKEWISFVKTKGLSTTTYTFLIKKNEAFESRGGSITFKQKDGTLSDTVYIKQEAAPGLVLPKTEYRISKESQQFEIEVQHNVDVEVKVSDDCDWLKFLNTKGLDTDHFVFAAGTNTGKDERTCSIVFKQKDGDLSATAVVRQSAADYIEVETEEMKVNYEAQTVEIKVNSNAEFKVDLNAQDWISLAEVSPDGTVTLKIAENKGDTRDGIVVFYTDEVRQAVKIVQEDGIVIFDDANFKAYCVENFDKNKDGEISFAEAAAADVIICRERGVKSTLGLEHFTNITILNLYKNSISSIDVTHNTLLKHLNLNYNNLSTLDVSHNPSLDSIKCDRSHLKSIDLSHNPALKKLTLERNELTEIDFSNNPLLEYIDCTENAITDIDVSFMEHLTYLNMSDNKLKSIDVSHNYKLEWLILSDNQLSSVDISKNPLLISFVVNNNQFSSIDISAHTLLEYIGIKDNFFIESLDVSKNPLLVIIEAGGTSVKSIDLSNNPLLDYINLDFCHMTELDVSHNPKVKTLSLRDNDLTELDLSHNPDLEWLACTDNRIAVLDVSNNLKLKFLTCSSEYLKELWLKEGQTIDEVFCNVEISYK